MLKELARANGIHWGAPVLGYDPLQTHEPRNPDRADQARVSPGAPARLPLRETSNLPPIACAIDLRVPSDESVLNRTGGLAKLPGQRDERISSPQNLLAWRVVGRLG